MIVLLVFAVLAGAGTALTPCVLPVLPAVLSAGAIGGARRPLGIALGLVATFTITIVGVAEVVDGVGAGTGALRWVAVVVLASFGLALAVPAVGERIEAPLSRLARFGPRGTGRGFWSGLAVGGALGFVCAPCAGPILAAVISVSASQGTSARLVAIALAYAAGMAAMLALFAYGSRRAVERVRRAGRGPGLQRAVGGVLVATALVMALQLDVRFETALANHVPAFLVNPTRAIERSHAIEGRLANLRGRSRFEAAAAPRRRPDPAARASDLRDFGAAPDFTDPGRWFNTAGRPLTIASLRGRVVLIDFWTYTCINCVRTLPFLKGLDAHYRPDGLTIVGVHTPEFDFEHDAGNVAAAIRQNGLRYPVVQDNAYGTWNAYGNQYWPAEYLVDARGHVRYAHFGEGDEDRTEGAVRLLLTEAGARRLGGEAGARGIEPSAQVATPETYLGAAQAERFVPAAPQAGTRTYARPDGELPLSHFALGGTWRTTAEASTAVRDASLDATFQAAKVYLVLSSAGNRPRSLAVEVDGRHTRDVTVRGQRLYTLVSLTRAARHTLRLRLAPGLSAYAFTFG
jgi:cytochrome c biogenesis protein CcdA/thiol-disulfide isomerase/thioredoxin